MAGPSVLATNTVVKQPAEVLNLVMPFDQLPLESGETLTGTPVVTASPSGLTIANEMVNTMALSIDGRTVAIGEAVQFRVSGGVDGTTYRVSVLSTTTAGMTRIIDGNVEIKD